MSSLIEDLSEIWDSLPSVNCTGECQDYCTAPPMSNLELALVRGKMPWFPDSAKIRERLSKGERRCPALTASGRCGVYEVRPTVCRLFGAVDVESIRCPYGCDTPKLTAQEASEVMDDVREIGGPLA